MRISDWSSDVCSSDLPRPSQFGPTVHIRQTGCRNLVNDGARSATWIAEHHFDAAGMHGLDDSLGTGATWLSSGIRFDLGVNIGHDAFLSSVAESSELVDRKSVE